MKNISQDGIFFIDECLRRGPETRPKAEELLNSEYLKGKTKFLT